jgi:hypothetical protein
MLIAVEIWKLCNLCQKKQANGEHRNHSYYVLLRLTVIGLPR